MLLNYNKINKKISLRLEEYPAIGNEVEWVENINVKARHLKLDFAKNRRPWRLMFFQNKYQNLFSNTC